MSKGNTTVTTLIAAALLALAVAYLVPRNPQLSRVEGAAATQPASISVATAQPASSTARTGWAASAPGRVEPVGGEVRITAQVPGRIADVLVAVNDKVVAGDLLAQLDASEILARIAAGEAEASVRKADRDGEGAKNNLARDRRTAEDNVAMAERTLAQNRAEFDRWLKARQAGTATEPEIVKARETVTLAADRLEQLRTTLRRVLATDGLPTYTRLEAALAQSRAELSATEAGLEKTKIRAPRTGSVLQVIATAGETTAPSPDAVMFVLGDISSLRVRAELEERDSAKVRAGQGAIVRSDAFPGRDFTGKVKSFAGALGASRIGQKGPRKPNDIDVLEIIVELTGSPPLLPGMRVDVLLKPDETAETEPATTPATPRTN